MDALAAIGDKLNSKAVDWFFKEDVQLKFNTMKNLIYVFVIALGLVLSSCEEYVVEPRTEDDPIGIPPPPPPPPCHNC